MPYVEIDYLHLYYEKSGAGQPLLLLHGATGGIDSMAGWPALASGLAEHYRVVLLEHRGHGRTDNPAGSLSYALIARDIAGFIEHFDLAPAHLAGVSDGATVGLALAMTRPTLLRSLTCIGANVYMDDQLRDAMEFFDPDFIEQHHPEYATLFAGRHDPHHYPGYWRDLVRQVRANVETELVWGPDDLQRIPVPVLYINGENDIFVSRQQMLDMRDWTPDAELLILNHAGRDGLSNHLPQSTRPEAVEPVLLEFLSRHSAAPS
jgi:pimeloyl-ACP methyl ester carboxylesterase